jgi:hypothetical protein
MRRVFLSAFLLVAGSALAQQPRPEVQRPEVPPPPRIAIEPGADEPRVRIAPQAGDRVEEIRENGRVKMLKVTPANGVPYYLVDTTGSGNWMRRDSTEDGLRVPMWSIWTFD